MEIKSPISFQNTVCSDVHVDTTTASRCSYHSYQLFESKWFLHIKITSQNIPGLSRQNNKSADERRLDGFAWCPQTGATWRVGQTWWRIGSERTQRGVGPWASHMDKHGEHKTSWLLERRLCNKTDFSPPHSNVSLPRRSHLWQGHTSLMTFTFLIEISQYCMFPHFHGRNFIK